MCSQHLHSICVKAPFHFSDYRLQVLLLLYRADSDEVLIPFSEFYSTSISDHASLEVSELWVVLTDSIKKKC